MFRHIFHSLLQRFGRLIKLIKNDNRFYSVISRIRVTNMFKALQRGFEFTLSCFFPQVNDFPDFLSGAERENTQHIVIKYYTDTSGKNIKAPKKTNNGKKKGSSATMQQSLDVKGPVSEGARNSSVVRLQRSVRLTSRMSGPTLTEELNSLDISRAKNDELSPPTDQSKHKRSKSWKGHESAKESKNEKRRSSVTESMIMQTSTKSKKVVKKTRKLKSASTNDLQNVTPSTSFNLASTMLNRYSSSQYDQVEKKSRPLPNPADKWDSDGKFIDTRTKEPLRLTCSENGNFIIPFK